MSSETKYGVLCEANNNDTLRDATQREAMESLSDGYIEVDGVTAWVIGVEQASVCGKLIQMDLSGVQLYWLPMVSVDLTPSVREELEEAIMEEDEDTGEMVATDVGRVRIGGVWYRWGF